LHLPACFRFSVLAGNAMSDARLVEVYRARDGLHAQLLKNALEDAEIPVRVVGESVAAMDPGLWWASPRIVVAEVDAAKAVTILQDLEESHERRDVKEH
jgi:putative signal transducing protein